MFNKRGIFYSLIVGLLFGAAFLFMGTTYPVETVVGRSDIFVDDGLGVVIGHTKKLSIGGTAKFQVLGTTSSDSAQIIGRWSNNATPPKISFAKSRGTTIKQNTGTILQDNDIVGLLRFCPDDGVGFTTLATQFGAEVDDASPEVGDIGMAFTWEQMAGGGGTFRETMRLSAAGNLIFIDGSTTNSALTFGAGEDSRIYYDGIDTFWDLRAVGTGDLMVALATSFPSPDPGTVHIWAGNAGSVAATSSAQLVLENSGNVSLDFLTADIGAAGIRVVTPTASGHGAFLLGADASGEWSLRADGDTTRIRFSSNTMAFQQASTISTTTGDLTLNPIGNVVMLAGNLTIGTEGGGQIQLMIKGSDATGTAEGGELQIFTADDFDTTINFWRIDAFQDDLRFGNSGGNNLMLINDGTIRIADLSGGDGSSHVCVDASGNLFNQEAAC